MEEEPEKQPIKKKGKKRMEITEFPDFTYTQGSAAYVPYESDPPLLGDPRVKQEAVFDDSGGVDGDGGGVDDEEKNGQRANKVRKCRGCVMEYVFDDRHHLYDELPEEWVMKERKTCFFSLFFYVGL